METVTVEWSGADRVRVTTFEYGGIVDMADSPPSPSPCRFKGEYLTGLQRRELNVLDRNVLFCTHSEHPSGLHVKEERERGGGKCGPSCKGYEVGDECPKVKTPTELRWAYGVTTVPERRDDLLPRTLLSLRGAGFPCPRLFVDGCKDEDSYRDEFGLEVTGRYPKIRTHGNWVLSAYELFIRDPNADRYAVFQDDVVFPKGLREYLERCQYPEKGYLNLYTHVLNEKLARTSLVGGETGWYRSNQKGFGALALIFDRQALITLLASQHMVERPMHPTRGWRAVDGGIVSSLNKGGYSEFVHYPSLCQHLGDRSTMGNRSWERAPSFRGEPLS